MTAHPHHTVRKGPSHRVRVSQRVNLAPGDTVVSRGGNALVTSDEQATRLVWVNNEGVQIATHEQLVG
jgi:hypothetical protein